MLKAAPKNLCVMGDSLTDNCTLQTLPHDLWSEALAVRMRNAGVDVLARNFARNGSRSDMQLAMMALMTKYGVLDQYGRAAIDYGIIWGGANDQATDLTVTSITSTGLVATVTTTANHSLKVNSIIAIMGADQANYNISARVVSVPSANSFTYALLSGAASPATGTITWNIPIAGTQENIAAMVKILKTGAKGVVLNETALPVARIGERYVVLVDGSSDGGIDAPPGHGLTARIAGAGGNAQTVWECRHANGSSRSWGRIAVAWTDGDKCTRIIVGLAHYKNHAANAGDNVNVASGKRFLEGTSADDTLTGIYYGPYQTLRSAQKATALAERVPFCDNHAFVSGRIAAGLHTQGSDAEHFTPGNQHFNRYGYSLIAQAMFETMQAQSGWLTP